jgi:2-polyprenyl-3-methyl-5-hydroxy-6-metoxy-1,4-benzoquinol methylase
MNKRICPACASNENKLIGHKLGFDFGTCKKCGTLYTLHEPNSGEEQSWEEYGGYGKEDGVPQFVHQRCDELIKPFDKYRKLNTFLDIGFGAGTITQAAGRAGWKVFGVEVSKVAVDFLAHKHPEYDLYCGYLEDRKYDDNSFDAIAIVEVVEHVLDPIPILKEAYRILRPGGVIWVTTPNLHSLSWSVMGLEWSMVTPPDHLELYTKEGATIMLEASGFKVKKIITYGINPYEIKNHFKSSNASFVPSERVNSGYELNESMGSSSKGRFIKNSVNSFLNIIRKGDSMKVWAEKPI